ncbi:hypothetical protein C5B91_17090 [Haloferax sp. Atlit-10N]|uniref:Uncharacterized protein n=1 Tax=Haloferax prahovense (strain DSM 18310 / JCM 13924 / TL6) TaxID=1227461 RepID=M0FX96_HALPT|nr:hypothetical protein C457_17893 [Haloferax prahovense DSM 18310]RDZ40146.1 hypothetical protein C5B86_17735 [Haloferax sp. Atlit-19N]RDZ40182.1 hypothetical protein C5B87_17040 [Haloferax sp. Atlit-16N]RDZ56889.1 hypothetical protein C5B91_17090 [Haloferax sp. Atlit-10N]REA02834.1 hypothetical protein DEQ92_13750 [Haloferax sp. Atlit-6N]
MSKHFMVCTIIHEFFSMLILCFADFWHASGPLSGFVGGGPGCRRGANAVEWENGVRAAENADGRSRIIDCRKWE